MTFIFYFRVACSMICKNRKKKRNHVIIVIVISIEYHSMKFYRNDKLANQTKFKTCSNLLSNEKTLIFYM